MSALYANAVCASRDALLAFHPKRPIAAAPAVGSHTLFGRPLIPSPSASSGSADDTIVASLTASSNPSPKTGGAIRGEARRPAGRDTEPPWRAKVGRRRE